MSKKYWETLTSEQRDVVLHGCVGNSILPAGPLLVLAGAGTGKTGTLAAFAAHRRKLGADLSRILILVFNRAAAREIKQRVRATVRSDTDRRENAFPQCDTFHAAALGFVRRYGSRLGLEPNFTLQDRPNSALLMDRVLAQQEVGEKGFPDAEECLKIYSLRANTLKSLRAVLSGRYGQYARFREKLAKTFRAYDRAKRRDHVVDFDDLLTLLDRLLQHRKFGDRVRALFDYVLVDEYQDTTPLQDRILQGLRPNGRGLVLVGDDDQCIYGFRGVTPQHILDRAKSAKVLKLTQSHRSPQPILDACNAVIGQAGRPTGKMLWSKDKAGPKPKISIVRNDLDQVRRIVKGIEEAQAAGVGLRDQAVLARTAEETRLLEAELTRLGIPYRKNGGGRLVDHAGLKTALAILSWCENPRDRVAGAVALQVMLGIDPATAFRIANSIHGRLGRKRLLALRPTAVKKRPWAAFANLVSDLGDLSWDRQVPTVCRWLREHGSEDAVAPKLRKLSRLAHQYRTRADFLAAVNLRRAEGAPARISERDRLTISTIHSAKGLEWTAVYVMNAVEGCIPSRIAQDREEERRLLFVSMTRAKRHLELLVPKRLRIIGNGSIGLARTSLISKRMLSCFELNP
jgi:DNA helicase-2/ATP-dependent DNA helicase PcrA